MSVENVQKIIDRAAAEAEYRELLFSHPDQALKGYELTDLEVSNLKGLAREEFDAAAGTLEGRLSLGLTSN